MIEKMKKLSLLIYHASKEKFLNNLQDLGVVHLEENKSIHNEEITKLNERLTRLRKVENVLNVYSKKTKHNLMEKISKDKIDEVMISFEKDYEELNNLENKLELINRDISILKPWGSFEPDILEELKKVNVKIKFYSISSSAYSKLNLTGKAVEIISALKGKIYFVIFYKSDEEISDISATEEKIPNKNLLNLFNETKKVKKEILKQHEILIKYLKYIKVLSDEIIEIENKLEYFIANANLKEEVEGKVLIITGWIPIKKVRLIEDFFKKEDTVYLLEDPKQGDVVPILLRNKPGIRLFEPLIKLFSLPAYVELDTTVFVAPFFAFYFGLCQADIGYGLIIFIASFLTLIFIKSKTGRSFALLGIILSIMVIIGGIFLNGFFGYSISDYLIDKYKILPQTFNKFIILSNQNDAMLFALLMGIIQILFAYILRMINQIRNGGFQAGILPVGNFFLLFGIASYAVGILGKSFKIGPLKIGEMFFITQNTYKIPFFIPFFKNKILTFPSLLGVILFITGTLLILFFNNPDKKIYKRPLYGLWEMYGNITGIPGDILSYLRLFALGLSGGLLGKAVNDIAFMAKGDSNSIIGYFVLILIMVLGHSINLVLSLLGSFVHPLRLTFVEFYKNVGFTGGGIEYSPFSYKNNKN